MAGEFSFSGIGSGIDGRALAQALGDRYRLPNEKYQQEVSDNKAENDSLSHLRDLLSNLSDSLDALRTANGGAGVLEATSSNKDVVSAAAGAGAQSGSYLVNVQSLATIATGSFGKSFGSTSDTLLTAESGPENLDVTVGQGQDAATFSVSVDGSTTVQDFITQFNQNSGGRAYAALVNVGTDAQPDYRISFATQTAGTADGSLSFADGGTILDGLAGTYLEQATDAKFTVSGVSQQFTRSSNSVTDAINGLNLDLKSLGTSYVSVQGSSSGGASQVQSFVKAFNDVVKYINSKNQVTSSDVNGETINTYGSLAHSNVDDDVLQQVRGAISDARSADGSTSLASLGVSTNRDGTLSFDPKQFQQTYSSNPNAANEVVSSLADKISGVSGVVYQYTAYGLAIDQAVQANELDNHKLSDTMDNIDRRAAAKEQTVLDQFTKLEGLYAQLQGNSSYLSSLLKF